MRSVPRFAALAALALALAGALAAPLAAQTAGLDTVRAQPLDGGKMWLFEDPPTDYLARTYGFRPDAAWFERARLAALRMPGCSASFVSPHGLVATNHHCVVSQVVALDRGGEGLLDDGFRAARLADERPIEGMTLDQAVAIDDVTAEIAAAVDAAPEAGRAAALEAAAAAVQRRLLAARGVDPADEAAPFVVQVVPLYNGGRYSAYTYRRFRDVRMVMAPENALGAFGGDADNFTYPRYAGDFALMRVYEDGRPYRTEHFFPLSETGVAADSLVFVVGNPGSTSRGLTVAQLELLRDVSLPAQRAFLDSRVAALNAYLQSGQAANPDAVRAQLSSLRNQQKAVRGRLAGLRDPYIIARRAAAERDFLAASPAAGPLVAQMAALVAERRAAAAQAAAFTTLFNARFGSATLRRALAVAQGNAAAAAEIASPAAPLERAYLAAELDALQAYLAGQPGEMPKALQGGTAAQNADALLAGAPTARAETAASATAEDPAVALVARLLPDLAAYQALLARVEPATAETARGLGRARFQTFGATVPPDATFSLRFTDGVVQGYPYNGTDAPPVTTLAGVFDRYYSHCVAGAGAPHVTAPGGAPACDWQLPERWTAARARLDLATPVNFTSTSDTIGGNSGSPAINRRLELVGLNFDRTIEGLVRDYLYAPERGRNVMVDTRLVVESLRNVYRMDALADELTRGTRPR